MILELGMHQFHEHLRKERDPESKIPRGGGDIKNRWGQNQREGLSTLLA